MTYHTPVLTHEVATLAAGRRRVVDGTLGGGGHAAIFQQAGAAVLGIDRDPAAIAAARTRLDPTRLTVVNARFGSPAALEAVRNFHPGMILLDLGVSSHHFDDDTRGFSFRPGVKLDMRMSADDADTAADVLNQAEESELAEVFADYADERRARKLARVIVKRRQRQPFAIADDLVNAIRETLGPQSGPPDFARIFQGLRIAVNRELEDLATALPAFRDALEPGGTLAAITYHSGEDRIVKNEFREWARSCICPPGQPICTCRGKPLGEVTPRKPILPSEAEIARNSRARSAKLRVFVSSPSPVRDRGQGSGRAGGEPS